MNPFVRKINIVRGAWRMRSLGGSAREFVLNLLRPPPHWYVRAKFVSGVEPQDNGLLLVTLKDGRELFWPADSPLSSLWLFLSEQLQPWHWHFYQPPGWQFVPGDRLLDCGASCGLVTALNSDVLAASMNVEPDEHYHAAMRATFSMLDGVDTRIEKAWLTHQPRKDGECTIDDLCATTGFEPTLIKMDLESAEEAALAGATKTLVTCRPRLYVTVYHIGQTVAAIENIVKRAAPGYQFCSRGIGSHTLGPMVVFGRPG